MNARFTGNQMDKRWRGWDIKTGAAYQIEIRKAHWIAVAITFGRARLILKVQTWKGPALFGYRDQKEIDSDWKIISEE